VVFAAIGREPPASPVRALWNRLATRFQPKLAVSPVQDPLEREADRIADRVVGATGPVVQRSCAACPPGAASCPQCEEETGGKPEGLLQRSADGYAPSTVGSGLGASGLAGSLGSGRPLDASTRASLEPHLGRSLGQVRIHTGPEAAGAARALNAHAFTLGQDIAFAEGAYAPGSTEGRRLMAHEIVHTIQQAGGLSPRVQCDRRGDASDDEEEGGAICPSEEDLDEIEAKYRAIVQAGRDKGFDVAADNLEHFLGGSGTKLTLSVPWLSGFDSLASAERVNEGRFEDSLNDQANTMAHAESRTFNDYWHRQYTAGKSGELYYASGTSTIKSTGTFNLSCIENVVSIGGKVDHHWYDPYDWHAGLSAFIHGFGDVSDEEALAMQNCRGAKPFDMEADWTRRVSGSIKVGTLWNDKSFTWSGP